MQCVLTAGRHQHLPSRALFDLASRDHVLEWEFTDSQGNVLHEATLVDESTVAFSFDLPLTDTLFVSVLHTNDSVFHNGSPYPWACLVEDYLVWEETEIIPGTFQGSWTLGGSSGVDVSEPATCVDPDLIDPSAVSRDLRAGLRMRWDDLLQCL